MWERYWIETKEMFLSPHYTPGSLGIPFCNLPCPILLFRNQYSLFIVTRTGFPHLPKKEKV
jgi:hypothetical protein